MSRMGGLAKRIPDAYWTMTVALLALAAIPPFAGFFSKEAVLVAAEHTALGDRHVAPPRPAGPSSSPASSPPCSPPPTPHASGSSPSVAVAPKPPTTAGSPSP